MNKIIVLIIAILIIFGIIYYLESMRIKPVIKNTLDNKNAKEVALKDGKYQKAPELTGIKGHINTKEGLKISELKGKVVLVDFWTYSCINCIRTLPFLTEWYVKYKDRGLEIIGVHTPEFDFEKDYNNVLNAVKKHNIKYPVVQDNDYATWAVYKNRYWPHKYLIDKDGYIRYDHVGEGAYDETEEKIKELLAELGNGMSDMPNVKLEDKPPQLKQTPELYAGFNFALPRGQNIGNKNGLQPNKIINYKSPKNIEEDIIYLEGKWKSNSDNLLAQDENESSIVLNFIAGSVNIVADSFGQPLKLNVHINNEPLKNEMAGSDILFEDNNAYIIIDEPRLYNVFNGKYGRYILKVTTQSKDFSFNAFTFG